jgi:DNA-binding HxlR family transcriptional regulator
MNHENLRSMTSPEIRGDCTRALCPARKVLAHVTGRWGSLILHTLQSTELLRFSQLRTAIEGISEKMLSQTLRDLERDGLIARHSKPVVPPHVEYSLTHAGRNVAERVRELIEWIEMHLQEFTTAQNSYDTVHQKPAAEE